MRLQLRGEQKKLEGEQNFLELQPPVQPKPSAVCRGSSARHAPVPRPESQHASCITALRCGQVKVLTCGGGVQHPHLEGFALRSASGLCQDVTALLYCFTRLHAAWWRLLLIMKKILSGIKKLYCLEHDHIEHGQT